MRLAAMIALGAGAFGAGALGAASLDAGRPGAASLDVASPAGANLAALYAYATTIAQSVQDSAHVSGALEPGSELSVYLMTMGPGDEVWEVFGHNAIWIIDRSRGSDIAYNYGIFSFDEDFYGRLVRGDMLYMMAGFDGLQSAEAYAESNRSVIVQELNLTPAQRVALRDFLQWNALPENRDYAYDYFDDNCSTRVRDAIDDVLGGQLREQLEAVETDATYRSQSIRLSFEEPLAAIGMFLSFGPSTDQPLSAWEESFIPMRLRDWVATAHVVTPDGTSAPLVLSERTLAEANRPAAPADPRNFTPPFLALGALLSVALIVLGLFAARGVASARIAFGVVGVAWSLFAGLFGTIITGLWLLTNHTWTYGNENVLQANPLVLVLAPLVLLALTGRARRAALLISATVAALAAIGFIAQALPWLDQVNGAIIALALPAHLGLAIGLRLSSGSRIAGETTA